MPWRWFKIDRKINCWINKKSKLSLFVSNEFDDFSLGSEFLKEFSYIFTNTVVEKKFQDKLNFIKAYFLNSRIVCIEGFRVSIEGQESTFGTIKCRTADILELRNFERKNKESWIRFFHFWIYFLFLRFLKFFKDSKYVYDNLLYKFEVFEQLNNFKIFWNFKIRKINKFINFFLTFLNFQIRNVWNSRISILKN